MPFTIIRGDITRQKTDAIVNSANPKPIVGYGVDQGIHDRAGPDLLEARRRIGALAVSQAGITLGYRLKARYVIHAVGPVWKDGTQGEEEQLRLCYANALRVAEENNCRSISFPLISAGNCGFPRQRALEIALDAFRDFLEEHEMDIVLTVFGKETFRLSGEMAQAVESYIDDNYVRSALSMEYRMEEGEVPEEEDFYRRMRERREENLRQRMEDYGMPLEAPSSPQAPLRDLEADLASRPFRSEKKAPRKVEAPRVSGVSKDLEEKMSMLDASFSETLLTLIDQKGLKDPEVYKKANLDRKLFSKIRSNPRYRPSKPVAVALAVALELNMDGIRDLVGRAGYSMTHSSKFDTIVECCVEHGVYNIFEMNEYLFHWDQPLLGSLRQ